MSGLHLIPANARSLSFSLLLAYFGEGALPTPIVERREGCCDNCLRGFVACVRACVVGVRVRGYLCTRVCV
jgi:hypothetical protein